MKDASRFLIIQILKYSYSPIFHPWSASLHGVHCTSAAFVLPASLLGLRRQQRQLSGTGSLREAETAADFPDESSAPYFARLKIEHKDENQQPGNQNLRLEQIDAHHFPDVTDRTVERRYADCELGQELHVRFEERLIEDLIFQLVFHSPVPAAMIVTTVAPLLSFTVYTQLAQRGVGFLEGALP